MQPAWIFFMIIILELTFAVINKIYMPAIKAYGALSATAPITPLNIERREPKPMDVEIEILYCGVCHSDLHTARNEWGGTIYPCVPGHEIVGRVTEWETR